MKALEHIADIWRMFKPEEQLGVVVFTVEDIEIELANNRIGPEPSSYEGILFEIGEVLQEQYFRKALEEVVDAHIYRPFDCAGCEGSATWAEGFKTKSGLWFCDKECFLKEVKE